MNINSKQSGIKSIKIDKWITFYNELLTENRKEFKEDPYRMSLEQHSIETAQTDCITTAEVSKAIKSLRNGQFAVPGGIPHR